jgi:beta-phosphoglucomutase-like phosphatase (HAD superfamily)
MSRPLVITCKTCGRPDVPDWGDGNCITCARDAVLEHPAHDNQGSQPPYASATAHDTPEQRLEAVLDDELDMLPIADESINLLKARILAAVASSQHEELQARRKRNKSACGCPMCTHHKIVYSLQPPTKEAKG